MAVGLDLRSGGVLGISLGIEEDGSLTLNIHDTEGNLNANASVTVEPAGGVAADVELADAVNLGFGDAAGTTLGTTAADILNLFDGVDIGTGLVNGSVRVLRCTYHGGSSYPYRRATS